MVDSAQSRIRLFVPTFNIDECMAQIRECLELGWTGAGFKTVEFEREWAIYTGVEETIFLSSNSLGLDLALRGMKSFYNWDENSEIISTALTFVSTNHAILINGLKPIFADIDSTLCLDPSSVRKLINSQTKAIIYVGIGGNAANLAEIRELCDEFSLMLIIDAAHMAGTKFRGMPFDEISDATIYSFQAVKNLPTADSGAIFIKIPNLRSKIRKLSWLGISSDTYARSLGNAYKWKYEVEELGLKANGNSIMASIALSQLKLLDHDNSIRQKIVVDYKQGTIDNKLIEWIHIPTEVTSSYHLAQVRVKRGLRDLAIAYLDSQGIETGVHYRLNTRYPMYAKLGFQIPNAENAESEILSLPLHLRLGENEINRVVNALNEFAMAN